ncbi:MAG: hypothetical protein LBC78_01580 [Oscillospiraceae bacterium]|jgi:hypothetical protein|nr:hypothetical protein [Oscillospiraceae bacterium]
MKNGKKTLSVAIPAFIAAYLAASALPFVALDEQLRFSGYGLPVINVIQILIYPALLLALYLAFGSGGRLNIQYSVYSVLVSALNLVFLFLQPIVLQRQAESGWPSGWGSQLAVQMQIGYYILYCLTIGYLAAFLVRWRIGKVRQNE